MIAAETLSELTGLLVVACVANATNRPIQPVFFCALANIGYVSGLEGCAAGDLGHRGHDPAR